MVQVVLQRITFLLICIGFVIGVNAQRASSLTLSASVNYGFAGLDRRPGLDFAVQNIETGKIYYSLQLSYMGSRHSVIEDLPSGNYQLIYLGRITSEPTVDSNVVRAFNVIMVEKGHHYYLGFINGRARAFKKGILEVQMCRGKIEKVQRKLIDKEVLLKGEELEAIYPHKLERFTLPL